MEKDLNYVKVSYNSSLDKNVVFVLICCCNILQNIFCNTFSSKSFLSAPPERLQEIICIFDMSSEIKQNRKSSFVSNV